MPNGMGDLQRGERYVCISSKWCKVLNGFSHRYANMDFIFLSCIVGTLLSLVIVSYDIACQWYRNFFMRVKEMPHWLQPSDTLQLRFRVPKFHLPSHVKKCFGPF